MAPPDEADATGGGLFGSLGRAFSGRQSRTKVAATADITIPKVDKFSDSISNLNSKLIELRETMHSFSSSNAGTKFASQIEGIAQHGPMGGPWGHWGHGPMMGGQQGGPDGN